MEESTEIDLAELQRDAVLGKVTEFYDKHGTINGEIEFNLSDCVDGFVPARGDWVAANVEEIVQEKAEG